MAGGLMRFGYSVLLLRSDQERLRWLVSGEIIDVHSHAILPFGQGADFVAKKVPAKS
jgi:hypothetical protein